MSSSIQTRQKLCMGKYFRPLPGQSRERWRTVSVMFEGWSASDCVLPVFLILSAIDFTTDMF